MPIGATAKCQVEAITKTDQVRERVVLAIVKNAANMGDLDLGRVRGVSTEGSRPCGNAHRKRNE
jgi:hypothetical protein